MSGVPPRATEAIVQQRVLALPVHQDVDDEQIERVLTVLRDCPALVSTTSFVKTGRPLRSG